MSARTAAPRAFMLPNIAGLSPTYFVTPRAARLRRARPVSRNFYWLSTKPETLDWDKSTWYHTPTKTFADFTALNQLPRSS